MNTITKSPADLFLETTAACPDLTDAAKATIVSDMEKYDRPYFDKVEEKDVVVQVGKTDGYNNIFHAARFRNDPWSVTKWKEFEHVNKIFFTWINEDKKWVQITFDEAKHVLYITAHTMGFLDIPTFNNVEGYMVSFSDLLGSIPEYMREILEKDKKQMDRLKDLYEYEKTSIIQALTTKKATRTIRDENGEFSHTEEIEITKVSFCFERFNAASEGQRQTAAYFGVYDASPERKYKPSYNWHGQEDSRVLSNGALTIDYFPATDDTEACVSVSSNH